MQYYRSQPQSTDAMWRAECASVADYCTGVGLDPGAGGRTLDADTVTMDLHAPAQHSGDACAVPFGDNFFDHVANFHLLEHLPDPRAAIREWLRVVKPGGHVCMVIPDTRFTNAQNTDATPHLAEYSPREFVRDVLGAPLGIDQRWNDLQGWIPTWANCVVARLSEACPRWSFAVVLRKLEESTNA